MEVAVHPYAYQNNLLNPVRECVRRAHVTRGACAEECLAGGNRSMAEEMKPLESKDKVFIKSLGISGVVVGLHHPDDEAPEAERVYRVQMTRLFRRSELELNDAERKQEEFTIVPEETERRLDAALEKLQRAIHAGPIVRDAILAEFLAAVNDYRKDRRESVFGAIEDAELP